MAIQSAKFERGRVFFPRRASWLTDLETELFSFPASRHDDQVDSIRQALAHEISYGWNENNLRNLERFSAGLGGWRLR
jgi:phage terminase large subunit-like protein